MMTDAEVGQLWRRVDDGDEGFHAEYDRGVVRALIEKLVDERAMIHYSLDSSCIMPFDEIVKVQYVRKALHDYGIKEAEWPSLLGK